MPEPEEIDIASTRRPPVKLPREPDPEPRPDQEQTAPEQNP